LSPIIPLSGASREPEQGIEQLARFLYRPIVFQQPNRVVHPPSWVEHIPFAFWIVEALQPAIFVELGTQSGNSYSAFAQAIQALNLSTAAYAVDTWIGDPQAGFFDERVFTEWAAYHDHHFSAFSRMVRSTFKDAAGHFSDGTVDLLHLDGCHTYEAAAADFRTWRPKLSRRSVVLLHDINVREGDFGAWRLWEELKDQFSSLAFLHGHGLGVLGTGPDLPDALRWLFSTPTRAHELSAVRQFFAQVGGVVSARQVASEIERRLRAELTATVADRVATDAQLSARTIELAAKTTELTRLRAQLSVAMTDLDARAAEKARSSLRYLGLEDQLAAAQREHEQALRGAAHLSAELLARLRVVEAERAGLTTRSVPTFEREVPARINPHPNARPQHQRLRRLARTAKALGLLPSKRWSPRTVVTFLTRPAMFREARVVLTSGLFDEGFYRGRYPDVAASRLTPLAHFVLQGARQGRSPNPLFDGVYYLKRNPDVMASGVNPLIHYFSGGAFEGRNPHPLFDVSFYLSENPDVRNAGVEPLRHFLTFGATDSRNPSPFFDCRQYQQRYPDVVASGMNPLVHYVSDGWRERRSPSSSSVDAEHSPVEDAVDVPSAEQSSLAHSLDHAPVKAREVVVPAPHNPSVVAAAEAIAQWPVVRLKVQSLAPAAAERPTVLCLSHVMPWPPRAGNEYRIFRMLCWLRDQGYRVIPVIAPLPGDVVPPDALRNLADTFSNAVLCDRDGRLQYVLRDLPDVLASLNDEFARPASLLLGENPDAGTAHERQLLEMDRTFCHDALITTALRLHQVLGRYVLLAEYIWMARILPLVSGDVLKVIDTIDVFSTKREKVLQYGITDLHVDPQEEARRLRHADLIIAIQDEERRELQQLLPDKRIVTAGVDFSVVEDAGVPEGRRILYVASDNPMNRKGLADFLRFAWPRIRQDVPDAELLLAGRITRALDADVAGVVRLGPVDDLKPLYRQCRVVINPAVAGTGLKIKTLEALGHLRPLVTWPNGTDGLPPELSALCTTVQDWFEFSRRVAALLAADEPPLFSQTERDAIVRLTSPAAVYRGMTDVLAESLR